MRILLILMVLMTSAHAERLGICKGEYALCAASSTTPTGKLIKVGDRAFKEGVAICPVLNGESIADLDLMNGSCDVPNKNKVWSLFGLPPVTTYPQAPTWAPAPAVFRSFTVTKDAGMSNMWSYLCEKSEVVNGVQLANCFGPINESPWTHRHVIDGETAFTQAPVGAINPVGGNFP